MRTLGRSELVVADARKENRDDRRENSHGRVPEESARPAARRIRRTRLGSRRHGLDEPITPPRYGLDKSSTRTLVAKNRSEAADDNVKTVIEVDVPIGPQPALDLLTSNQLSRPL